MQKTFLLTFGLSVAKHFRNRGFNFTITVQSLWLLKQVIIFNFITT